MTCERAQRASIARFQLLTRQAFGPDGSLLERGAC